MLEISYDEGIAEDIKLFGNYYDDTYLHDMEMLESVESMQLYHLLFTEFKKINKDGHFRTPIIIEMTEFDFKERGIAPLDIEGILDENLDEINGITQLWYEYDAVLNDEPDPESDITHLSYRIIFGMHKAKNYSADYMDYAQKMRKQKECMAWLSIVMDTPLNEEKMTSLLETANYDLNLIQKIYKDICNIQPKRKDR